MFEKFRLLPHHINTKIVVRGEDAKEMLEEMFNPNHPNQISDEKMKRIMEQYRMYKSRQKPDTY